MNDIEYESPDWDGPPGVHALTTLRPGGVSRSPCDSFNLAAHVADDPAAVTANRRQLIETLGLPSEPVWLDQVHGTKIANLDEADTDVSATDGAVTSMPGRVCVVLTADCLPMVLATAKRVGVFHLGWRGLAAGMVEAAIEAMNADPEELVAWMGPSISGDRYEVGIEVVDALQAVHARPSTRLGHYMISVAACASHRLRRAGTQQISRSQLCTYDDPRCFSYRKQNQCGRMATLVWLEA